jgi:hypothetical protein
MVEMEPPPPEGTHLASYDPDALATREGRIELTKNDPLAFALIYLPHHLRDRQDNITFADLHYALLEHAKQWIHGVRGLREDRDCYVAPRECGKSTWLFLILPMWVAAHEYFTFIAAYSDAVEQARTHLATFRDEVERNELLRWDYPELCRPKTRGPDNNRLTSQRQDKIEQANGFVFVGKGMNAASLGLKIGNRRPELIILDDIEPGEEKYSLDTVDKRLEALRSKIFYQNQAARVVLVGTVTRIGSIIHQLVESALHPSDDTPEWIVEENFKVHYFAPIIANDDGSERSCWPEKWSLAYLKAHENEREYQKNFANQPVSDDGDFWTQADITYKTDDMALVKTILEIDPAVTTGIRSHYTGIAIVGYDLGQHKCLLRYVRRVKLGPKQLRRLVLQLLDAFPEISIVRIESNQGGETWRAVFHDMPVRILLHPECDSKELRNIAMLNHYQRHCVVHEERFREFENQLFAYPKVMWDDDIDAVSAGVEYFLKPKVKRPTPSIRMTSYV